MKKGSGKETNLRLTNIMPDEYQSFLKDIKEKILKAQYEALKAVNKELISLYWDIGKKDCSTTRKRRLGKIYS